MPTVTPVTSTSEHLRRALSADPSVPRLTFYDDQTGERVELSTTTVANWVAKTVNLLVLECGLGPGGSVALHLGRHWLTAIWVLAADAVGAEVVVTHGATHDAGLAEAPVDVAVVGPDRVDDPPDAAEVFAVSLAPLGAPFSYPLPALVRDFSVEARTMPDQVSGPVGPPGGLGTIAEQRAAHLSLGQDDRIAAHGELADISALVDEWLAPLAAGASVLWVRNPDPHRCVPRWGSERVTAIVGSPPGRLAVPESIRILR